VWRLQRNGEAGILTDEPSDNDPCVQRADEYEHHIAAIVCQFQQAIEWRADCDYAALRAALGWARKTSRPVTMASLHMAYQRARRKPQ
jgi:hypothetical protein